MKCEKCGKNMVERNGRYGPFYGCTGYPKCRNIQKIKGKKKFKKIERKELDLSGITPSKYQEAILNMVKDQSGNAVIEAVAGSGKTTTLLMALKETKGSSSTFVAFNKAIVNEIASKCPEHVQVKTIHSLGFAAIRAAFKGVKFNNDKLKVILANHFPKSVGEEVNKENKKKANFISKVVPLLKGCLTQYEDKHKVAEVLNHFGMDDKLLKETFEIIVSVMEECKQQTSMIDFSDMCWLPVVLDLPLRKQDFLFIDEAQDLNRCQMELVKKAGNRVIAVGDRYQSIYGFRGANSEAIPSLIEELEATALPLSICYRCPKSHIELAKQLVPHIEAFESNEEGDVNTINRGEMGEKVKEHDLVLCRCNAPLVSAAFELIKSGKKATIRGKDGMDIQLINLAARMNALDLRDLNDKLDAHIAEESARLERTGNNMALQVLVDKVDCLKVFIEMSDDINGMEGNIRKIFSEEKGAIILSTVHQAKGLEADNVFILAPELLPHPMAEKDWEIAQENNIHYVALTRAKKSLTFVPMEE